ncbi:MULTISPECIES: ROK family transcriptional regulator [Actinomyces]|uniref:ROK family transcriptional regulator n=1 Tax=Actinomyces respiraculi TaxID=2744574 RepID=A0A7T0PWA5_9ACTO|nr:MULTISPECIES: ROK family transcriptional regulator [Actinomyces]QPL05514.1 ROK family transcriptional regulator [Actinomyces respiraculi]
MRAHASPRPVAPTRALILASIRRAGDGLTRAQISRATRIAPQTVSNVTRDLLAEGLLRETGVVPPEGRGRPGTVLELNPSGGYAAGIHLDPSALSIVVVDLLGHIVAEDHGPLPSPVSADAIVEHARSTVERLCAQAGVASEQLLGIGLAVPGPVNHEDGTTSPPLLPGLGTVPLRRLLAEATGHLVLIDKDLPAMAQGHLWTGEAHEGDTFILLYMGAGTGMATVVDGRVLHGQTGNAGETMHLPGNPFSTRPGSHFLGDSLSERILALQARNRGLALPHPADTWDPHSISENLTALIALARAGDADARAVFEDAGETLAATTLALTEVLDISTVIMTGLVWQSLEDLVAPTLHARLAGHTIHGVARPISISTSAMGRNVGTIGAACLVLESVLGTTTPAARER